MEFKTIAILAEDHAALVKIAEQNNRMKLYAVVSATVRGWPLLTAEQHMAAIRGDSVDPAAVLSTERTATVGKLCNMIQRGAIDLDALVDEVAEDGIIDANERVKVRRFVKELFDKLCNLAAHVAEPAGALA